jgi:hypothetical protein
MKLHLQRDLASRITFVAEVLQSAPAHASSADGLLGFLVAEVGSEDSDWYSNCGVRTDNLFPIVRAEPGYTQAAQFLDENRSSIRLFPFFYARQCLSEATRTAMKELAANNLDVGLLVGSTVKLYTVNGRKRQLGWTGVDTVQHVSACDSYLSRVFMDTYIGGAFWGEALRIH